MLTAVFLFKGGESACCTKVRKSQKNLKIVETREYARKREYE